MLVCLTEVLSQEQYFELIVSVRLPVSNVRRYKRATQSKGAMNGMRGSDQQKHARVGRFSSFADLSACSTGPRK
eukprot:16438431-Heterocapsa_arctica.AAC.1